MRVKPLILYAGGCHGTLMPADIHIFSVVPAIVKAPRHIRGSVVLPATQ